jgi:hypothetical protein
MAKEPKNQKNVQLPPVATAWLHEQKLRTGTPYARLGLAAIVQFAGSFQEVRDFWLEIAGRIEAGELSFDEISEGLRECEVVTWEAIVNLCRKSEVLISNGFLDVAELRLQSAQERAAHRKKKGKGNPP